MKTNAMLRGLAALALAGLIGSIVFHALAINGIRPLNAVRFAYFLFALLHIGVLILGAFYFVFALAIRVEEGDWWQSDPTAMLRGYPLWIRIACIVAVACIGLSAAIHQRIETAISSVFYALFFVGFYSLMREPWRLTGLTCPNGHSVSYRSRFCKTCGAPMPRSVSDD